MNDRHLARFFGGPADGDEELRPGRPSDRLFFPAPPPPVTPMETEASSPLPIVAYEYRLRGIHRPDQPDAGIAVAAYDYVPNSLRSEQ